MARPVAQDRKAEGGDLANVQTLIRRALENTTRDASVNARIVEKARGLRDELEKAGYGAASRSHRNGQARRVGT
jgi:hypothetical protein